MYTFKFYLDFYVVICPIHGCDCYVVNWCPFLNGICDFLDELWFFAWEFYVFHKSLIFHFQRHLNGLWPAWRLTTLWEIKESGPKASFFPFYFRICVIRMSYCYCSVFIVSINKLLWLHGWIWWDWQGGGSVLIWLHGFWIRCTCCYWLFLLFVYPDLMNWWW